MLSWGLGQDANWDLRNYHLYNPFALLEGRLGTDLVPASLQSFFNPLADIPYYILATKLLVRLPRTLAVLQGLYFGGLVYFVWLLNWHAFKERSKLPATTATIATLIGVSAAGVISEVGTTFNDIQSTLCFLWGIYLLMPRSHDDTVSARRALWAGVAFGVAVGIKLTVAYYIFAAVLAVFMTGSRATSMRTVARVCITAGACILLLNGGWCLWVYHQTGNPVFPVFNELFRSDWYPPLNYARYTVKPTTVATAIFYPFVWAGTNTNVITEVTFRDARFAAAWLAAIAILALSLLSWCAKNSVSARILEALPRERPMRFLFALAVAAYLIWLILLSLLRFGFIPEVLTGMVIVLGIQVFAAALLPSSGRATAVVTLATAVGIGLQAMTIYPQWGRLPFEQRPFTFGTPPVPPNSMVVLAGVPLSFIVPFLRPKDFVAVGISHHTEEAREYRLFAETKKRILGHAGPAFVITNSGSQQMRGLARDLGITWTDASCKPIPSNVEANLHWCEGRIGAPP